MKNAMKKLLSLVLVAMLLVSVVPMGAMAAEDETVKIGFVVNVNGKQAYPEEGMPAIEMTQAPGTMLSDLIDSMVAYGEFDSFAGTNGTFGDYEVAKNYAVVSGETYTLNFTQKDSSTDSGSNGDSENKKFDYCIRWYYFDSEYITEEYGTVSANGTVKLNKYTNIDRVKVDGNAEKISDNEVKITGNQAVVDVFLTTNNPNGSTGGNPGGSTGNNKYTYNVRIYDKNGDLLKDRGWFDADANSTVYLDVNNFEYYTVNGSDTKNYTREVKISSDNMVIRVYTAEGTGSTSEQYTVYFNDADNNVVYSAKVNKGEVIGSKIAEAARDEVKNDKKGYTFEGWRLNGAGNILSTDTIAHTTVKSSLSYYPVYSKNGSDSDKLNSNKVYLHIFLDNKVSPPARDVNITDTIAKDGVVTMGEVQDVVKKYYSAKNDDGIKYDGMYMATGSWVGEFVRDDKIDRIDNIDELKKDGYVHINVMVNNAKAKSSSNADSSNPKTGDDIYMTVTVMGLSAAALCAVYFVSKKRAVR